MNEKNLNKLRNTILKELGCNKAEFFPSLQGIDIVTKLGDKIACLIDFRNSRRYSDDIFTYTDDYLLGLKALNKRKNVGLILVCDKTNVNKRPFVICPQNAEIKGFRHLEAYDEFGQKIHIFVKIHGNY